MTSKVLSGFLPLEMASMDLTQPFPLLGLGACVVVRCDAWLFCWGWAVEPSHPAIPKQNTHDLTR